MSVTGESEGWTAVVVTDRRTNRETNRERGRRGGRTNTRSVNSIRDHSSTGVKEED
jgi:hypothetical protein